MGDDPGFAASRPGQDQQRAFEVLCRFALLWVEAGEEVHVASGKQASVPRRFRPLDPATHRNPLM